MRTARALAERGYDAATGARLPAYPVRDRIRTRQRERPMMPARRTLCLTLIGALGACAAPGRGLPPLPDAARSAYRLGPEDHLWV